MSQCARQLAVHPACWVLHSGESVEFVHLRIFLSGWYLFKIIDFPNHPLYQPCHPHTGTVTVTCFYCSEPQLLQTLGQPRHKLQSTLFLSGTKSFLFPTPRWNVSDDSFRFPGQEQTYHPIVKFYTQSLHTWGKQGSVNVVKEWGQ